VADELAGLSQQLARLTTENATLRARLEQSETARTDLVAQMDHILELLGDSRRQLNAIWQTQGQAPKG
jgi:nitrate/nitrite-specific signal transduction histidine kinase